MREPAVTALSLLLLRQLHRRQVRGQLGVATAASHLEASLLSEVCLRGVATDQHPFMPRTHRRHCLDPVYRPALPPVPTIPRRGRPVDNYPRDAGALRGGSTPQPRRLKRIMLPATFTCPRCKCHAIYLARRRGLDRLMSLFGLRPARCMTCDKRFYLRHSRVKNYDPETRTSHYAPGQSMNAAGNPAKSGRDAKKPAGSSPNATGPSTHVAGGSGKAA